MAGATFQIQDMEFTAESPAGTTVGQSLWHGVTFHSRVLNPAMITTGTNTAMQFTFTSVASGYGEYEVGSIVTASVEDLADISASDRAVKEARVKGTRSWRQVKRDLGL